MSISALDALDNLSTDFANTLSTIQLLQPVPPAASPAKKKPVVSRSKAGNFLNIEVDSLLPVPGQSTGPHQSFTSSIRAHRSPKRSFDESSTSDANAKLTAIALSHTLQSSQAVHHLPPPLSSTPPACDTPPPEMQKPFTRRQRKALGLPKSRTAYMSAGKIVIPGGKFKKASKAADDEEWQKNGTGRLDVRGFRELKI
ncbi:hypothetical protein BDR07DRAFT_1611725 [Suillus spraguei]|nr:hypothetical protein BDR07DRAFT_1611725 [Suillus spraguei]